MYMQERWRNEELVKDNPEEFAIFKARELSKHMLRRSLASRSNRKSASAEYSASPEELEETRSVGRMLSETARSGGSAGGSNWGQKLRAFAGSVKRRILAQPGYMELYEMTDLPQRRRLQGNSGKIQAIQAPDLGAAPARGDLNVSWYRWQSVSQPTLVDWSITPYMTAILNQQFCESCWAMTATDLVSVVSAQINNATAELLSAQHACDCSASKCCQGGWPEWVFQFIMLNGGLAANADYPYVGMVNSSCASVSKSKLKAKISGWEKVPARSNGALMKAVAQHPVLVYIAASSNDFINYSGGIFFGQCSGEIDHAVLVVGYSLTDPNAPVWIIKNTWGSTWGEGGYMRLPMLADGPGKCNMLSERGIYPIFYDRTKGSALCKLPINPCGGGTCVVTNGGPRCNCPPGYVERLENDAPKCTLATPCDSNPNPCGIGTCYNEFDGSYTCVCPPGSVIGSRVEGTMTCVLGTFQSGLQTYTILQGDTCGTIASTFGFTVDFLQTKNPFIDCSQPLTPGYVILVGATNVSLGCSAMDIVSPGDTCSTVAARNNITVRQLLGINPTLNCNVSLQRSQALCVAPGALSATSSLIRSCGRVYNVGAQDRCVDIARGFNISLIDFMWLNPGLRCDDNPINNAIAVCVAPLTTEFVTVNCNNWYTVTQADSCPLMANTVGLTVNQFLRLNPGLRCYPPYLQIGQAVCVNGTAQSMTKYPLSPNIIPFSVGVNDTLASISQQYASMCPNNTYPQDICASNSFPDCTDQSITPGQMILIPCTRKIGGDVCATSLPVCGSDFVTYPSTCHAVLNFALPLIKAEPCDMCNQGICQNRTLLEPAPNKCPAPPGVCPLPSWPLTPDYFYYCPMVFKTQCDCLLYTCDYLCNRAAAYYKYSLGSKYTTYKNGTVFKAACNSSCMSDLRTGC
ncbi:hypothetical protein CLOP_g6887 [Closterium sp. NIES-67]|nr:hypothetical protein CLOP_g6887 [Closterium sp. NIES-67]